MNGVSATYRLQIQPGFNLAAAREWIAYGQALGVSHLYASPLLAAMPGSTHGYDVCDPRQVNPELGGEAEFAALTARLRDCGMGLILDIVPNHMAASPLNPYWRDLLELGSASPYAAWFDIDWTGGEAPGGKILLPLLGEPAAQALAQHHLQLHFAAGEFQFGYYEHRFPVSLSMLPYLLATPAPPPASDLPDASRHLAMRLPASGAAWDPSQAHELQLALADLKARVGRLCAGQPAQAWLAAHLAWWNLVRQRRDDELVRRHVWARLLAGQAYRLLPWRGAGKRVNYRRFFALNHLVGVRQELPAVFEATHSRILEWLVSGQVQGLRIDHVDGLFDPGAYLHRLQRAGRAPGRPDRYLVVEKILAREEALPPEWPVAGTTGYDCIHLVNELFLDPAGMARLSAIYARFIRRRRSFPEVAYARQRHIVESHFSGELKRLRDELLRLAAHRGLELDPSGLESALRELTICLPVYRSYRNSIQPGERDRELWERTWSAAQRQWQANPPPENALRYLRALLLPDSAPGAPPLGPPHPDELLCLKRWQQWTGAVKAKGIEDTAFYTYNRLLSQNEVGGDPASDGLSVPAFHALIAARRRQWPRSWNAATTHDTKRSEDARIRLNLLSEMPAQWGRAVRAWQRMNRGKKQRRGRTPLPGLNLEYYLYQTLLAAWPPDDFDPAAFQQRIRAHMLKAAREAKGRTRWRSPDPQFEAALAAFVERLLPAAADSPGDEFLASFLEFARPLAQLAAFESLAQLALRLALPGSPDIYQGAELWDLRLVDPDNRAPVDFALRRQWLAEIRAAAETNLEAALSHWLEHWPSGRIKLYLTWRALQFRRAHPELCLEGDYLPLEWERASPPACAFARRWQGAWLIAAAPLRLLPFARFSQPVSQPSAYRELRLRLPSEAPARWRQLFTGEQITAARDEDGCYIAAANLWDKLPAAWLVAEPGDSAPR